MMRYSARVLLVCFLLVLPSTLLYADDLEIFGGEYVSLKPNVLIVYDNSGSMNENANCTKDQNGNWVSKKKILCAKETLDNLVTNVTNVNFGLMSYNTNSTYQGGKIVLPCNNSNTTSILKTKIKEIYDNFGGTGTPLAETLAEAGLYFTGQTSWYAGTSVYGFDKNWYALDSGAYKYKSPVQCDWQKNYIIFMSDGDANEDGSNCNLSNGDIKGDSKTGNCRGDLGAQTYVDSNFRIDSQNVNGDLSMMDDIARFLYVEKGIKTYTIGFATNTPILGNAATAGGGTYTSTNDGASLEEVFEDILTKIQSEINSIYATPAIPRNPQNKSESGDDAYLAFFRTQPSGRWLGNLKGYGLSATQLMDNRSTSGSLMPATGTGNVIMSTAQSYWPLTSTLQDGLDVFKGGVGDHLKNNTSRKVYTFSYVDATNYKYSGTNPANPLTNPDSAFELDGDPKNEFKDQTNPSLTPELFAVPASIILPAERTKEKQLIVKNTLFQDASGSPLQFKDADGNPIAWKLGDIIHSEPFVESYEPSPGVFENYLFVGANDGMLHVFDTSNGSEVWAFVPPNQFSRLKYLLPKYNTLQKHYYFVDGSPVIEKLGNEKLLIFGEGRGGDRYYALKVTDPLKPWWVYQVTGDILGNDSKAQLGQAWAKPQLKKIKDDVNDTSDPDDGTVHDVFLLAGGYDPEYEASDYPQSIPESPEIKGRAIYTVNAATGQVVGLNINGSDWLDSNSDPVMNHSIVEVAGVDAERRGYMDRVYAGDLGGNVFAAKYDDEKDIWEKMVLMSLPPTLDRKNELGADVIYNGTTIPDKLGKKIMTRPTITLRGGGECIYFGTGDREHLKDKNYTDAFYSVCNKWKKKITNDTTGEYIYVSIFDTDEDGDIDNNDDPLNDIIKDVTDNRIQDSSVEQSVRSTLATQLENGPGWFFRMENAGEKITSSPIIRDGKVIFTTFEPGATTPTGTVSCEATFNPGKSRLYVVDYKTGAAVIDFDTYTPGLERSTEIGKSVAYSPVMTTKGLKNTLWTGSGGGLGGSLFDIDTDIKRYYWRQIK